MPTLQYKPLAVKMPRVLVVDDEPALVEVFHDVIGRSLRCRVSHAASVGEAKKLLARQEIDLLITDVMLPDGSGLSLLEELHRVQPRASALVISGVANMDVAIGALRGGAVDFIPKPFQPGELTERIRKALLDHHQNTRREVRIEKLKKAFKRLNAARRLVSKKVDLLCNDLIGAYGDLSRQFDTVRLQQGYRQFINQASGLEQLLCHNMDWLLRQLGYSNIGIWLASDDQELQLGAYMKYTVAAENDFMEAVQRNLLRMVTRRGFMHLRGGDIQPHLTPPELKYLATQDILAVNCTYLGDTLAVMVLFRDEKTPFSEDDVNALKTAAPLFALALARSVRGWSDKSDAEADAEPGDADALGSDGTSGPQPGPKKIDPADWWKRGESPPF